MFVHLAAGTPASIEWCLLCPSLIQFSLSLEVKFLVSVFGLASPLPQFISTAHDFHLLGICHVDLLRTRMAQPLDTQCHLDHRTCKGTFAAYYA